jgi:hypothetical protein
MTTISAVETTAPAIFAVQASEKALAPPPPGYDVNDPLSNLNPLPVFATKEEEREHAKQQMAGLFRVFARHGYSEGHNGHISLRGKALNHFPPSSFRKLM